MYSSSGLSTDVFPNKTIINTSIGYPKKSLHTLSGKGFLSVPCAHMPLLCRHALVAWWARWSTRHNPLLSVNYI